MKFWTLIAMAVLGAGCEQWKAPKRIHKLEERVEELAADVAALQGSDAKRKLAGAVGSAAGSGEAHAGSGDAHASAGDGHGPGSGEGSAAGSGAPAETAAAAGSAEPPAPEGAGEAHAAAGSGEAHGGGAPAAGHGEEKPTAAKPTADDSAAKAGKLDKKALDQLHAVIAAGTGPAKPTDKHGRPHWSYDGATGPQAWGSLDPGWSACSAGKAQSPIDIEPRAGSVNPIKFIYKPTPATIIDNGHTLQVNLAAGNSIEIDGRVFDLLQFHFHTPSEHTIAGEHYPLEVHLVHQGPTGKLAVIGVLYDAGPDSKALANLWTPWPRKVGVPEKLPRAFDPSALLPETRTVFRYAGSLTTPPCTEGVLWNVMRRTLSDGKRHLDAFRERFKYNAREPQPRNDRKID